MPCFRSLNIVSISFLFRYSSRISNLYCGQKPYVIMSEETANYLELEYEHLYNVRDQTILFLKMCPKTTGLAEEMLTWLDQKVRMLGEKLMEKTE